MTIFTCYHTCCIRRFPVDTINNVSWIYKAVTMQLSKKKEQPLFLLFIEVFFTTFSIHINGFTGLFTLRNLAIMITIIVYCIFCHLKLRIDFSDKYYKRFFFSWVFRPLYEDGLFWHQCRFGLEFHPQPPDHLRRERTVRRAGVTRDAQLQPSQPVDVYAV